MARPLRIEYPGAFHHVMSRGNDGTPIVRDDTDRKKFLELLVRAIGRFGWILHDWVLMTNHLHFSIETPECTLSDGMHWLLGTYAGWFNRRHTRRGHLFQDRFKNCLVEQEEYLLTVARYIVLNPVKAGMGARPEDYPWSSYRARAGYDPAPPWLSLGAVASLFGGTGPDGRAAYRTFIDEDLGNPRDLAEECIRKLYLGSASWIEKIQKLIDETERSEDAPPGQVHPGRPELEDVVEAVTQTFDTTGEAIRRERGTLARRVIAYLAFEDGLVPLRRIARGLGVTSAGGISNLAARCRSELAQDADLCELIEACRGRMKRRPPPFRFPIQTPPLTARRYHRAPTRSRRLRDGGSAPWLQAGSASKGSFLRFTPRTAP